MKIDQSHFVIASQGKEIKYAVGDLVMLSTLHHHGEYKKRGELHVAKFLPHWDGPYKITKCFPEVLSYTLDLPNSPNTFPSYHSSELKQFFSNDDTLPLMKT